MQEFNGLEAYNNLVTNARMRSHRFPSKNESLCVGGKYLLPLQRPRFKLEKGKKIFTIGSCFAREIENKLKNHGFYIPVLGFNCPAEEFVHPPSHLLNEYNAGTILQRIESAYGMFDYDDRIGVESAGENFIDLFLHIHQKPVTLRRLKSRRKEIDEIYSELVSSDYIVITLGLTESWFDKKFGCYLNKAPAKSFVQREQDRFVFRRLDIQTIVSRIASAIQIINAHQTSKIIITVSPVPMEATFSNESAIVANSLSKSTLRICAAILKDMFSNVEYFPSYEIATSSGLAGYAQDNIHVTEQTIDVIMNYLIDNYVLDFEEPSGKIVLDSRHYLDVEVANRNNS